MRHTFVVLFVLLLAPLTGTSAAPVVETTAGTVRGMDEDGVSVFRGIPYAAPPVGELRWRPAQPAEGWTGTKDAPRDATTFGTVCPQALRPGYNAADLADRPMGEDCLTLNV